MTDLQGWDALFAKKKRCRADLESQSQRIVAVDEFIEKGTPMPALLIVRPVQIRIKVADVQQAARFYTAAFDVVFNEAVSSVQFGTYRSDQFFLITLEERDREAARQSGARFGLLVDDVDAAHHRVIEAGGAEIHPAADFVWKPRTSCVGDLDGNVIDLSQA